MKVTGLCLGASNESGDSGGGKGIEILEAVTIPRGNCAEPCSIFWLIREVRLCATGRKFRHLLKVPTIPEPQAVERAYAYCRPEKPVDAVVSAGRPLSSMN